MLNEPQSKLFGFFDDLIKETMGKKEQEPAEIPVPSQPNLMEVDGDEEWNESDFRSELQKRDVRDQAMDASENESSSGMDRGNVIAVTDEEGMEEETEFDGYMVRACTCACRCHALRSTVLKLWLMFFASYVRRATFFLRWTACFLHTPVERCNLQQMGPML